MRNGRLINTLEVTTEPPLQTPEEFVLCDFEPEEIAPAAKELRTMWADDRRLCEDARLRSLMRHYELGKCVTKHYDAVKKERDFHGESMYGDRFFQCVADAINATKSTKPVSWALLHKCYTLVSTYSEEAYAELCEHELITPTHAITLGLLQVDELRIAIQADLIKEGWTVDQLHKTIRAKLGMRRKSGAGRPLKTPKTVKAALVHSTEQARKFVKSNDEIWFGTAFDIPNAVRDIPADKLTEELRTKISEAVEQYDRVNETTNKNAQHLRDILANVDRRMQAQAEHDRRVQAEKDIEETACATAG